MKGKINLEMKKRGRDRWACNGVKDSSLLVNVGDNYDVLKIEGGFKNVEN